MTKMRLPTLPTAWVTGATLPRAWYATWLYMVVETDRSEGHQEFSLALDGDGLLNAGG